MSAPFSVTRPAVGATRPEIAFTSVLFPAAFAPTTETICPRATESEMPCSTLSCPYWTWRSATSSIAASAKEALLAEVGFDDPGIARDPIRPAFRDLLAVVQHDDAPRDRQDDGHHVLDDEEGQPVVTI